MGDAGACLAAILSAAAFIIAFPPISFWLAIVFAPAALAWLALAASTTRRAVAIAYLVHVALWLWLGQFLIQITAVGYPFYALYLAIYPALFVWIIRRIHSSRSPAFASPLPLLFTVPIVWVGLETLRGELAFNGYPWFLIAHPLIDALEMVQSADLFGTYFVSFLIAMISGALLDMLRYRQHLIEARALGAIVGCVLVVHIANLGYGYWRIGQSEPLTPGPRMLAVQTNMPQDNKLRADMDERLEHMRGFFQLTAQSYLQAVEHDRPPDLVIWPETMVFGYGFEEQTLKFLIEHDYFPQDMFYRELRGFVEQTGVPMLVGSPAYIGIDTDEEHQTSWDELYNSAYLIDGPRPHQRYDKHFLTPFGETMPYFSNWPLLERRLLRLGARGMRFDLDRGAGFDRLALDWGDRTIRLATPICFEVTMSRTCRRLAGAGADERADVFINLSNDGWFGWHEAGRVQHAQVARFRSVEHRIPMVRSVNTGLSMSIDSLGRITGVIGDGPYGTGAQAGAILAEVTLDARRTLYTVIGNGFAWLTLFMTAMFFGLTFIRRYGNTHHETSHTQHVESSPPDGA